MTTSIAAVGAAYGVWTLDEDIASYSQPDYLKQIKSYLLDADGGVCAAVQNNGFVVKCTGPIPSGSEFVRYNHKAFANWTVADAEAFEAGEAVDPWLPKANQRN